MLSIYFPSDRGISFGIETIVAAISAHPTRVLKVLKLESPSKGFMQSNVTLYSFVALFLEPKSIGQITALANIRGTATGYSGTGPWYYQRIMDCIEEYNVDLAEYDAYEVEELVQEYPGLGLLDNSKLNVEVWKVFLTKAVISQCDFQWARIFKLEAVKSKEAFKPISTKEIIQEKNLAELSENKLYKALVGISPSLAQSYTQIKLDIEDTNRSSWAGTVHEIREILANLLRILAPDTEVLSQSWYSQESGTSGPTQKQRVKYILQQHQVGVNEKNVLARSADFEKLIADLVRDTYSRASDAAHRFKSRGEVSRILMYFEAFAHDLLRLD